MTKHNGHARRRLLGLGLLPLLFGCTYTRGEPSATTASVLAAQYRARGTHGALTGAESQKITDSYQQHIGATRAPATADTADTGNGPDAIGTPTVNSAFGR